MVVRCYGIIPLRRIAGDWEVFLVRHRNGGYWAFPKGHAEEGEQPLAVAQRELEEETQLTVERLFDTEMLEEGYTYRSGDSLIEKVVGYFVAEVAGEFSLQEEEILEGGWFYQERAQQRLTFPEAKRVLEEAFARL